jgi:hypothetical protein
MAVSFRLVGSICVYKSAKLTLLFLEYSFDFEVSAALEVALSFFFSFAKKPVARKEAMLAALANATAEGEGPKALCS